MSQYVNNTCFSHAAMSQLVFIGRTVNHWRQRVIDLYEHPSDTERLISIGYSFQGNLTIVCDESRQEYHAALDYIAHGKVYHSQ